MYDIIIVGAGPAGLTAALYAGRANKRVLVLEAKSYGGQIINANKIENYPGIPQISGFDFASNLYQQVKDLGIEVKMEKVTEIQEGFQVYTSRGVYQAKSVILSTGVESRKLGLEKEEEFLGKGISYCATCDGAFFREKDVAVNGGGNTALEDALYLSNFCRKVYLIHRRDQFRGEEKYLKEISQKQNIEVLKSTTISQLIGEELLEGIEVITHEEKKVIPVSGLFVAIGKVPHNEMFSSIVSLTEDGYITSPDGVHTTCPHIYVAGDTREKELRQLTTAVSDGAMAATVAIKELEG